MKPPLRHLLAIFTLLPLLGIFAHGQVTPLGDSYTNTADPTTNYGAKTTVNVDGATEIGYIQFDLSGIPSGATVSQAMLKLYVGTVTTAGSFDVDYVNGSWTESTIDASNAPALGNNIASNVSIVKASVNQYILVNVTSAVQAWLNGTTPNDGIALVANSTTNVAFDSKESTTTSHSPELDIVYGGIGTITGVTTESGSGLSGGGTSGTLSLSIPSAGVTNTMLQNSSVTLNANTAGGLTTPGAMTLGSTNTIGLKPCSTNQILQYSGTAWNCSAASTGTITGVTTASGSGLTGGGTSGTLSLSIPAAAVTNSMLQNSSLTITAGTGLSGSSSTVALGGSTTLTNTGILAVTAGTGVSSTGGQSPTLSINTSVVPELSAANTFTKNLSTSGELAAGGTAGGDTANGTVEVDAGSTNTGTYSPGLNFGGGGQSIASDRAGTVNVKGIDFYTNFVNRMSLTNGGNLGIGTTSPTHLFEVDSAATAAQMAMVSSGTDAAISVKNTASGGREYWIDSGSGTAGIGAGNFGVYDATAGTTRFVINSTGEVGIGTTSPAYTLEVNGTFFANQAYANNSDGDAGFFDSESGGYGVSAEAYQDSSYNAAVYGQELGTTHADIGVWGFAASTVGIGSYSEGYSASSTASEVGIAAIGSWADTGANGGYAVFATADNGASIYGINDSSTYSTTYFQNLASDPGALVFETFGPSLHGCNIDIDGNHTCTGNISNAVPVGNTGKQVALYGVAAAENWFEDFGSGQLSNGGAVIHLEATFAQTVNTGVDYHVFLTPNGDCKGLYVSQKTATSFEVHELGGGTSNIAFDWRVTAKRAGFETARLEDKTPNPAMLQRLKRRPAGTHGPSPDDVRKAHMQKITELRNNAGATATAKLAPR